MEKDYISIGKILNFHGIKGEAKVGYSNKDVISSCKIIYLDGGENLLQLKVSSVRFHKNFAIMKFKEINSIDELIQFKGRNIYSKKEKVLEGLEENEFLINDLIGMNVFDDKEDFIGTVAEVQTSPANDILAIQADGRKDKILIPFVSELVPIVDVKAKKIIIKPIEGLI